jgi:accessory gene regulator protein AgrB
LERGSLAESRFDRACLVLLYAGLAAISAIVLYLWMRRLGSDLTWDEAWNFRVYARHPLTALGLYNEFNNHPLESFLKSVFYSTFGLDAPNMLRFTGFLLVVSYALVGFALFRRLARQGAYLGAALLVLILLLTRAFSVQAIEMRGYFLSILLQWVWFAVLARDTAFLSWAGAAVTAPRRTWTTWTVVRYAVLSALVVFTLPSNVLGMPPLWALTVAAFGGPAAQPFRLHARRFLHLGILSALFSALLYAAIFTSLALGYSRVKIEGAGAAHDVLLCIRDELALTVSQLAPWGIAPEALPWALAAVVAAGAVMAFRPDRRLARIALLVLAIAVVVRVTLPAVVSYATRVRCALAPPITIGVLLIVVDLSARWRPRVQVLGALALVGGSLLLVPALVREEKAYHLPSEVASFIETYARPGERHLLVGHAGLGDPLSPLERVFGTSHVVGGKTELEDRLRGDAPARAPDRPGFKAWIRGLILPEDQPLPRIDPARVEVLVLIDEVNRPAQASDWKHAALEEIKQRLPRRSEFRRDVYRMVVYEAPR